MNMYQKLENAANQWPENLFLVREGVTYSQFVTQVRARAATLRDAGVQAGDIVGILSQFASVSFNSVCNMVFGWNGFDVGYKSDTV